MSGRFLVPVCSVLVLGGWALPASAQVAAETATILTGTGQGTGSAARSTGGNVAGSLNRASEAIQAANQGARSSGGRGQSGAQTGYAVTGGSGDALAGTDAPSYQMGSGATIRVSGKLRQPSAAPCSANCPTAPAPAESPDPQ
jgi:hypothetical protein